jgi:hypothetical protein
MFARLFIVLILIFWQGQMALFGQVGKKGLEWIDRALEEDKLIQADSALKAQLKAIKSEGLLDSLPLYLFYVGRIENEKSGKGIAKVKEFIADFISLKHSAKLNKLVFREAAGFYEYVGELNLAYQANLSAFEWGQKDPEISSKELGKIQNNLGTLSLYLGNRLQAKAHVHHAIALYRKESKVDPESLYLSYNALGNLHWYGSRMDSAEYFFSQALSQFESMKDNPRNKYYRPAMVLNNLAGVQAALGKTSAGIKSMEQTIEHLGQYIKQVNDVQEIAKGKEFQYQAIDNLAGMHKGIGNYSRARDLLEYAYEQKNQPLGLRVRKFLNPRSCWDSCILPFMKMRLLKISFWKDLHLLTNLEGIICIGRQMPTVLWLASKRIKVKAKPLCIIINWRTRFTNNFWKVNLITSIWIF